MSQEDRQSDLLQSAENDLQEKNNILQAVYHDSLTGLEIFKTIRDEKGAIADFEWLFATKHIEDFIGVTPLIGKRLSEVLPETKQDDTFTIYTTVLNSGNPAKFERRYEFPDGEKWFQITISKYQDGLVVGMEDVSQQKRSELEIREQTHFIQSITEATPDILFVMNLDTREFIYANRAVQVTLGYSETQVLEMKAPFFDIMYKEDVPMVLRHLEDMKKAKDGELIEVEYRMWHADGSLKWFVDRNGVFRRDADGVPIEKIGISHDITAAKEAEEKIHALNRKLIAKNRELETVNSELKTFNNIAANDYKETLRTLYTNLEYIIKNDAQNLSDSGRGNIRKAQNAIQKMKLLTDDIVSFSRIPTLDSSITTVDLNEIMESVMADLRDKIEETGAVITASKLPVIQGFPMLLSLLFYHILDNAIKFRNGDTPPAIEVSSGEEGGNASTGQQEMKFEIVFSDNGIGFDPKQAEKIFSIFYRLHERNQYRGSGIGLAVCRKIMALHGGYITANGQVGSGTKIRCFFPA